MKKQIHGLAGDQVEIFVLEAGDDLTPVFRLVTSEPVIGFDTEGSGTDPYDPDWFLRLAQFGNRDTAYVLSVETHRDGMVELMRAANLMAVHHLDFDAHAVWRGLEFPLHEMYTKSVCTANMSRIIDPMGYTMPGAKGKIVPKHALKDRVRQLIDGTFDLDKALKDRFKELKLGPADRAWGKIPADDEVYTLYAGLDPILARRLYDFLYSISTQGDRDLIEYERRVSYVATPVTAVGQLVDEPFTVNQGVELLAHAKASMALAQDDGWPVTGVGLAKDKATLGEYLRAKGVKVPRTDPSTKFPEGQDGFAKDKLKAAIKDAEDTRLLKQFEHFQSALEAVKFEKDYLRKFLRVARHGDGRLHPAVGTMNAQTSRWSVYGQLPAQQMPRTGDVRGCAVADPGYVLVACDLSQVEVCVAAGLTQDPTLMKLVRDGVDVHGYLAEQQYGPDFTSEERNVMKRAVFGRLYGAGKYVVADQCGISEAEAEQALATVDRIAPSIKAYARKLGQQRFVTTAYLRRVAVDPERAWGAVNYDIQGTARDVWVQTLLRVVDAGMGGWIWLVVHDETILCVPEALAERVRTRLEALMSSTFMGVPIRAEAKVMGNRWLK